MAEESKVSGEQKAGRKVSTAIKKGAAAPKPDEKAIEPSITGEVEPEPKSEDDIIPEAGEVIVDEAEDEKELKEKIKDISKKLVAFDEEEAEAVWKPKTQMGLKVLNGEITSMHEVITSPAPIKEVGIVNKLLPELQEEVIDVGRVQRVTDSGRRMRFRVVTAVGNCDGYVGIGESKGKEAGPTIRKSIERAKIGIKEIKRGCGSWECGCGQPHSVPFKTTGRAGSITVTLMPAPKGVGIVSGEIARTILRLAGIKDVWVTTEGHTRTGINFARAVLDSLENTNYVKLKMGDERKHHIVTGQAKPAETKPAEVSE